MSEQAQRQLAEGLIDKVDRLEAENATLKQERDAFLEKWEAAADAALRRQAAITSMTAERDRLRQARDNADGQLIAALECHAWGECLTYIHSARAALSPSETEEGG